MKNGIIHHRVFIDECGYSIWAAMGEPRVGERAYRQVFGQRGRNETMPLAVSSTAGLVHYTNKVVGMSIQ